MNSSATPAPRLTTPVPQGQGSLPDTPKVLARARLSVLGIELHRGGVPSLHLRLFHSSRDENL